MHSLSSGEPDSASMLSKFESLWPVDYGGNVPPSEGDTLPVYKPGDIWDEGGETDEAEEEEDMSMLEQEEGDLPTDRLEPEGEDWPMDEPEGQALPTDELGADGFQGSYYLDQLFAGSVYPRFAIYRSGCGTMRASRVSATRNSTSPNCKHPS